MWWWWWWCLLPRWVKTWLYSLCKEYKHAVMDCAHPMPHRVVLYPGRAGGVQNAIMTETLHFLASTADNVELDALLGEDESDVPTLRYVEGSTAGEFDARSLVGCLTIVRFLGRHWHEYPLSPLNAARIDSALELLEAFLVPLDDPTFVSSDNADALTSHVRTYVARLEREQLCEYDDEHLGGFARATLADACWAAALRWLLQSHPRLRQEVLETNEFPQVSLWWQALTSGEEEEDDENDDATSSNGGDEDDKEGASVGETAKKEE